MKPNLNNQTLRVALNMSPPYVSLETIGDRTIASGGFEMKLLDVLSKYFNFQYRLIDCNSNWGSRLANGTWTGLMGMLSREEADLGLGGVSLTYPRSQAVPYLYPHEVNTVTFITPAPQYQPNIYLVFKPLGLDVWLPFIFTLFVAIAFDVLYNRIHHGRVYNKIFWQNMNSMFRQQYDAKEQSRTSANVWSTFFALGTFILTTGYAGCLCSLITIPIQMKTIDTCEELGEAATKGRRVIVTAIAASAYTDALKMSKMPIYVAIAKYLVFVASKNEGIELVSGAAAKGAPGAAGLGLLHKPSYAFISTRAYLRYAQLLYGEKVLYIPPENDDASLFMDLITLLVRPSFEHVPQFNRVLKNLLSAGLIHRWKKKEYLRIRKKYQANALKSNTYDPDVASKEEADEDNNNSNSNSNNKSEQSAFSISQLQSFFYVFVFSIIVSIVCFLLEMAHYCFRGWTRRRAKCEEDRVCVPHS